MIVENTDRSAVEVTLVSARDLLEPVWSQSNRELASSMLGSKENFEPAKKYDAETIVMDKKTWKMRNGGELMIQVVRLNKIFVYISNIFFYR